LMEKLNFSKELAKKWVWSCSPLVFLRTTFEGA
jgi:hypothetical protein